MRKLRHRNKGLGRRQAGFTLIEVLVVVAIIALLISILLPSLHQARAQASGVKCLSNLKQVGIGLTMYVLANADRYAQASSPATMKPRRRWPDYLHRQMRNEEVYNCPVLTAEQKLNFNKPWAHKPAKTYGGYGYNFQYLGNSRTGTADPSWQEPYFARATAIRQPAMTIAVADTRGSRKGDASKPYGVDGEAVYVIDPPLGSRDLGSKGSRQKNDPDLLWYSGGRDPLADEDSWRSKPDDRHSGRANVMFCDGHTEPKQVNQLDGRKARGELGDNRYYNGLFAAISR